MPERDRLIDRWQRAATVPAGQGGAVAVLTIWFPGCYLSEDIPNPTKQSRWLPAPPPGQVRAVQLLITRETEQELARVATQSPWDVVEYHAMRGGEALAIRTWCEPWPETDVIVEASQGAKSDLAFPINPALGTSRPVMLSIFRRTEELECIEYAGHRLPPGTARSLFPEADSLDRNGIIHSTEILKGLA